MNKIAQNHMTRENEQSKSLAYYNAEDERQQNMNDFNNKCDECSLRLWLAFFFSAISFRLAPVRFSFNLFLYSFIVRSLTFFTISAFPSTQTNLVSAFTARIMAKLIVTWSTKCRTRGVEIILRALHTNAEIAKWNETKPENI